MASVCAYCYGEDTTPNVHLKTSPYVQRRTLSNAYLIRLHFGCKYKDYYCLPHLCDSPFNSIRCAFAVRPSIIALASVGSPI